MTRVITITGKNLLSVDEFKDCISHTLTREDLRDVFNKYCIEARENGK